MGKTKIIGLLVVLVFVIGGFGGYMFYHQKSQTESFTATENIMDKLKSPDSKDAIVVFFSNGSDYSKAGTKEVLQEAKNSNYPVYYVDVDSPDKASVISLAISNDRLYQEDISKINAATLITNSKRHMDIIQYADKVDGKYVPLTDNIKKAFK